MVGAAPSLRRNHLPVAPAATRCPCSDERTRCSAGASAVGCSAAPAAPAAPADGRGLRAGRGDPLFRPADPWYARPMAISSEFLWEDLEALSCDAEPSELQALVVGCADALLLPPPSDRTPFTGEATGDALVFLCSDANGFLGIVRVPADRIDDVLRRDLRALHGVTFAGAADLTPELWDSALRVMSALALELRDAEEMAQWARDEGSALTLEDLAPRWERWAGCDVTDWAQLHDRPSIVCALRRAM